MNDLFTEHFITKAQELSFKTNELLSISHFSQNPHSHVDTVVETNRRTVLTRNGKPIAGLVPLWALAVIEDYKNGNLIDPAGFFGPDNHKN